MHVCLITGEYPPAVGGIADYSALLAKHLEDEGMGVSVVTGRHGAGGADGPRVETVTGWGLGSLGEVADHIRELQPDLVHLQYQTAAFDMSAAVCLLPYLLRAPKKPRFITTFHDLRVPYLFPTAGALRRLPARVLLGASDAAIFTDHRDLAAAQPRGRAAWIPLGPGVIPAGRPARGRERDRLHLDAHTFVIAYFGLMNSSKGVDTLLAAAERLTRTKLDFKLLIIGADQGVSDPTNVATAAKMRSFISRLDLEDRILETGWLSAPDISRTLAAADVVALPFADGASLRRSSLVTCLAHGLPVVTTTPAPRAFPPPRRLVAPFDQPDEFRIDENLVALVAPGDDAALAAEIAHLAEDTTRRKALARSGRRLAKRLAWPSIAAATAGFYRSVAEAAA